MCTRYWDQILKTHSGRNARCADNSPVPSRAINVRQHGGLTAHLYGSGHDLKCHETWPISHPGCKT